MLRTVHPASLLRNQHAREARKTHRGYLVDMCTGVKPARHARPDQVGRRSATEWPAKVPTQQQRLTEGPPESDRDSCAHAAVVWRLGTNSFNPMRLSTL